MATLVGEIMSGNVTDAHIGAVMAALATKGETFSEIAGAARAMRVRPGYSVSPDAAAARAVDALERNLRRLKR